MLRSTRQLSLTAAGERRLDLWRDVLGRLQGMEPEVTGPLQASIAITAPELFGQLHVMPLIEEFLAEHRHVEVRVLLVNRIVNLIGEGIDVAIRLAPLPDSTFKAVRVGEVGTLLCASPAYLERAGTPIRLGDLQNHECIGLNADANGEQWTFSGGARSRSIRVRPRLSVNNAAAAISAAVRGCGIVQVRSYQVGDHVEAGRLIRLLPQFEAPAIPAHIIFPGDRAKSRAVRTLIDHLTPALRRVMKSMDA